ncbi:V-type ATP synthase subunit A [Sediminispirochaeta smaragdinae]|jgi:V/A-type H+-transporting ATPase subunit A|uniref:V-type ATP synthase alpha chain n=1 Tax=Sediminispirochaeta smaragdinae (strain DSM 11293 / JCM 15392 / SEBR 4228) TaxID=573413 RepID=E1R4W8_SEDSS|nr:V-type ATP synthase subunit A [Sediminispirochaeta smaragdinae]ADK82206.1 Sodium-transporting two-sector ATPase [Sediminispirochaeta smaragdinae DSM 11293]
MSERIIGTVGRVNGPVIEAEGISDAIMMELVHVGNKRLVGEVIKLHGNSATLQVYEDTTGIAPGDPIYGSGLPLSVELGPGLIGTIYDGIQRPLERIREVCGTYIERGIDEPALDRKKKWTFAPDSKVGDDISGGMILGRVKETDRVEHRIMAHPDISGRIVNIAEKGEYAIDEVIAEIEDESGNKHSLTMVQRWPIRIPRPSKSRKPLTIPLITGQRVIDTLFPLAKGGTVAIPGGFGTGKTMTQHAVAKWCDADIIIYIGCGERGNEMTDVLTEFPQLVDPRTGTSLMERTILIANTSNMPVSAREASVYTGVTLAEYFRDQGYHVAVMADSTSRWAEAMRELSGRMEEMPAEEGFPAYLPTRIAEFYERAGYVDTLSGSDGSVSIIGAVSPPGGDFSEPVTQHTKRFVRCFWGLDRQLANARHYPAISWLESYSEYLDEITSWWERRVGEEWTAERREMMDLLQREVRLQQVVKLVGPDALPDSQRFIIEVCTLFKNAFLQQNAFDDVDRYSTVEKQARMLSLIITYWRKGREAIKRGATLSKVKRLKAVQELVKMKFTIPNEDTKEFDKLGARLERAFDQMESMYAAR